MVILFISFFMNGYLVKEYMWKYDGYKISSFFDINRKELKIETPYKKGGACHPKVVYFKDGFNGYKYWMAYTPYPLHNSRYENPCILASNNLKDWEEPKGIKEPCLDDLSYNNDKRVYNSDTHLLFNEDTKELECWWRYVNDKDKNNRQAIIYRRISKNGIDWNEKEVVRKFDNRRRLDYLSPSVIYENGIYKIWYVFKSNIWLTITKDFIEFTEPKLINIDYLWNVNPWHIDIEKTDLGYEMIYVAFPKGQKHHFNMKLYYSSSGDGVNWEKPMIILEPRKYKSWDNGGIYRSSLIKVDGSYHIIYTGWSKAGNLPGNKHVGLGYVSGSNIENLK